MKRKKLFGIYIFAAVILGLLLLIQLFPYGRDHMNPPVVSEPKWDSPQTRQLAARACFDCHSNETVWPWYTNIAPASWLVQYDVDEGREKFNFSDWLGYPLKEADEFAEVIQEGEMPPAQYLLIHSEARLTDAEKAQLIAGLNATLGGGSD
jgi:hypothetical protein